MAQDGRRREGAAADFLPEMGGGAQGERDARVRAACAAARHGGPAPTTAHIPLWNREADIGTWLGACGSPRELGECIPACIATSASCVAATAPVRRRAHAHRHLDAPIHRAPRPAAPPLPPSPPRAGTPRFVWEWLLRSFGAFKVRGSFFFPLFLRVFLSRVAGGVQDERGSGIHCAEEEAGRQAAGAQEEKGPCARRGVSGVRARRRSLRSRCASCAVALTSVRVIQPPPPRPPDQVPDTPENKELYEVWRQLRPRSRGVARPRERTNSLTHPHPAQEYKSKFIVAYGCTLEPSGGSVRSLLRRTGSMLRPASAQPDSKGLQPLTYDKWREAQKRSGQMESLLCVRVGARTRDRHSPRGIEGSDVFRCPRRKVFLADQARERRMLERERERSEAGAAAGPVMRGLLAPAARQQQHCESDILRPVGVDDACAPLIVDELRLPFGVVRQRRQAICH